MLTSSDLCLLHLIFHVCLPCLPKLLNNYHFRLDHRDEEVYLNKVINLRFEFTVFQKGNTF